MNKTTRWSALVMTVLLVLALAAVATVPVMADGGPTTPGTVPAAGRSAQGRAQSSPLSQLPSGTKVVILDPNGDKVALGSQQAAQLLADGDPIWCPATLAAPTPDVGGCTQLAPNLATLINNISTGVSHYTPPAVASTIWILGYAHNGSTADSSAAAVVIDGNNGVSNFATWKNLALTIQGGWKGPGQGADTTDPSRFGVTIWVEGWNANVTVNDVLVQAAGGDGLEISTAKNITLKDVTANANTNFGAELDNTNGNGTVMVSNSQFTGNGYTGLNVTSKGAITLTGVQASNDGFAGSPSTFYDGVWLDNCLRNMSTSNCTVPLPQPVTISGTNNVFNNNKNDGVGVFSAGAISLSNVTASGNATYDGAWLVNCSFSVSANGCLAKPASVTAQPITVSGNSIFDSNNSDGLDAESYGNIRVSNITAIGNGSVGSAQSAGAWLYNDYGGATGTVTINSSTFSGNYYAGLLVQSFGAITASSLTANLTASGPGAVLDNCVLDSGKTGCQGTAQNVTLTGLGTFTGNDMDGLDVYSFGNITVADLNANLNAVDPAITQGAGAYLQNDYSGYTSKLASKGTVTMTGTDLLSDNSWDGLDVYSNGSIKAGNIHAVGNAAVGAWLENDSAATAQAVTLTNNNAFSYNGSDGLDIQSKGAITLSTTSANDNGGLGALLLNPGAFSAAVTLAGNDAFNGNYDDGLDVISSGTITVNTSSLVADFNGITGSTSGSGVYLNNAGASGAKAVTVNGTNVFNGNGAQFSTDGLTWYMSAGLYIKSQGSIKVNNVTASNGMNGAGAYLDNSAGTAAATITLTGYGAFNDNAGDGLYIHSPGTVTLTKIVADDNIGDSNLLYQGEGLNVQTPGKMTLTCGEFIYNADYGAYLNTGGTATLSGAVLLDNGQPANLYQGGGGTVLPIVRTCTLP